MSGCGLVSLFGVPGLWHLRGLPVCECNLCARLLDLALDVHMFVCYVVRVYVCARMG